MISRKTKVRLYLAIIGPTLTGRRPNKLRERGLSRTQCGGKYVDLSSMKQERGTGKGDAINSCAICLNPWRRIKVVIEVIFF